MHAPPAFQIVTFPSYSGSAPPKPYIRTHFPPLSTPFPRGNPHFPQGFPQDLCVNRGDLGVFGPFFHSEFLYTLFRPQTAVCFCQTEVTFRGKLRHKCGGCSEFIQISAEKGERMYRFSRKNRLCTPLFPTTHRFIHAVYITKLFHVYHFDVFVNLKTV